MKRILMLMLAALLVCSLALFVACNDEGQQGTEDTSAAEQTTEEAFPLLYKFFLTLATLFHLCISWHFVSLLRLNILT